MGARIFPKQRELGASIKRLALGSASVLSFCLLAVQPAAGASVATAARSGDLAEVRELIASGVAVNEPERDGSTAALWAAFQSDLEMLAVLIDAGADLDAANRLGVTPLLQAARTGDTPIVRALLEGGADLAAAAREGETPLMAAARAGSVDTVRLLLERGSDPNATEDYQGQTALMWAAAEGHADVVGVLLEAGADPDLQARQSELTERSTRTDFPTGGFTAAMWAARQGHEHVLQRLADAGADLNLLNGDGASALSIAVVNDRFDLAARMLDIGAEPDVSALYYAVLMRDATTDWLAKDGSKLRADYPNELTAFDLTRVLLEAGADPNELFSGQMHSTSMCCDTRENGTPFYRAAVAADVDALKLLIAHGADVEWTPEPSTDGPPGGGPGGPGRGAPRSPLAAAMNGGKGVGMAGGPGDIREGEDPPFREIANRNPADAMAVLLEAGADPNRQTGNGSTYLHDAARSRMIDVIEVLAAKGAALDALNDDGLTALDIAEGRRAEGSEPGPAAGGPPPGLLDQADDDRPSMEDVAARLRELMQAGGVTIVEHGVMPSDDEAAEDGAGA
ncbi:MAG TPA: ankyrin repeat domain-containing protein [Gammaproteobacteria bacterium]|nr:ankyrin repeat domain-containing protein [Gammaproteobacteria bacterium]